MNLVVSDYLEIVKAKDSHSRILADFFEIISSSGEALFFHPHDFSEQTAREICNYAGRDLYYLAIFDRTVIGYGMLRGWDEGYDIPSLGIAVHPDYRGRKVGLSLMNFLHTAAVLRNAPAIRLKVYQDNAKAVRLYTQLGYSFEEQQGSQLVGYLRFDKKSS